MAGTCRKMRVLGQVCKQRKLMRCSPLYGEVVLFFAFLTVVYPSPTLATDENASLIADLLTGLPHALVLENGNNEVCFILPAFQPVQVEMAHEPLGSHVLFAHNNQTWLSRLQHPHYVHRLHISQTFVFTTSLASALNLLVLRWLARDYVRVQALIPSCMSDTEVTPEESQLLSVLFAIEDVHPAAVACRLKFILGTGEELLGSMLVCACSLASHC